MSVPVSESAIQTKVAGAVFAGEQHQTRDCRGEPTLDQTEQASAQASTLHVRCDHQSADVDCMRIIRRLGHPDRSNEPRSLGADTDRSHSRARQFLGHFGGRLRQRRQKNVTVRLRFGDIGGALQRQQLTGILRRQPHYRMHELSIAGRPPDRTIAASPPAA